MLGRPPHLHRCKCLERGRGSACRVCVTHMKSSCNQHNGGRARTGMRAASTGRRAWALTWDTWPLLKSCRRSRSASAPTLPQLAAWRPATPCTWAESPEGGVPRAGPCHGLPGGRAAWSRMRLGDAWPGSLQLSTPWAACQGVILYAACNEWRPSSAGNALPSRSCQPARGRRPELRRGAPGV